MHSELSRGRWVKWCIFKCRASERKKWSKTLRRRSVGKVKSGRAKMLSTRYHSVIWSYCRDAVRFTDVPGMLPACLDDIHRYILNMILTHGTCIYQKSAVLVFPCFVLFFLLLTGYMSYCLFAVGCRVTLNLLFRNCL